MRHFMPIQVYFTTFYQYKLNNKNYQSNVNQFCYLTTQFCFFCAVLYTPLSITAKANDTANKVPQQKQNH